MSRAKFAPGQLIRHQLFEYRGVICDLDPEFSGSDDWYENVARTRPPKDEPWYHVLPHGQEHTTYVAERNLAPDESAEPVDHPLVSVIFETFQEGRYIPRANFN